MANDLDNLSVSSRSDLSVKTLHEVKSTSPELPSPSFVSDAVAPEVVVIKWREWVGRITHEAASSVSVKTEHKGNEQVMRIPKGFERLLTNLGMGRCVHEQHAQEHDVTSNTTNLSVVDLNCSNRSNLSSLNIEEAGNR